MSKPKIIITEPILESDFRGAWQLVESHLFKNNITIGSLEESSIGEVLIAKDGDAASLTDKVSAGAGAPASPESGMRGKVIGMIQSRRPGRIFKYIDEKYISLDKIKVAKEELGFISLIVLAPEYRGKGIGKLLINKALANQKEWGAKCVGAFAWQASPNSGSQKLFESCGFVPIKLHEEPWKSFSERVGPEGYFCTVCSNPCRCDYLEMVKYL